MLQRAVDADMELLEAVDAAEANIANFREASLDLRTISCQSFGCASTYTLGIY